MTKCVFARLGGIVLVALMTLPACSLFGGGGETGVCVSDAVDFTFGQRVYCYNDFDESECSDYDADEVNGAQWSFHSDQTCADRDLSEGSNPWP